MRVDDERSGHWLALGYRGMFSGGFADVPTALPGTVPLLMHRHHVALQGVAGPRGRLAYGAEVGVALSAVDRYVALEGEGRLGYVVASPGARLQGVVGGQMRLSGAPGWTAWPQFGVFVGLARAPVPFAPGRAPHRERNGLGLLVPGAVLFLGGVLTISASIAAIQASDWEPKSGLVWVLTGTAIGVGLPLTIVGGVRHAGRGLHPIGSDGVDASAWVTSSASPRGFTSNSRSRSSPGRRRTPTRASCSLPVAIR